MIDDECGTVGGMKIGRGNQSTGRKPAPVPLCPPQIPHDLTDQTLDTAVGSWRYPPELYHGQGYILSNTKVTSSRLYSMFVHNFRKILRNFCKFFIKQSYI
jgi:hypothetical protein